MDAAYQSVFIRVHPWSRLNWQKEMVSECFWPRGAKNITLKKVKRLKRPAIRRESGVARELQ
jgi:hypothetical protein